MAVAGTGFGVGAQRRVPVAVLVAVRVLAVVHPSPVCVQNDGLHLLRAAARIAGPKGHLRVLLLLMGADLLCSRDCEKAEEDRQHAEDSRGGTVLEPRKMLLRPSSPGVLHRRLSEGLSTRSDNNSCSQPHLSSPSLL